jgi:hypothetical protein
MAGAWVTRMGVQKDIYRCYQGALIVQVLELRNSTRCFQEAREVAAGYIQFWSTIYN